METESEIPIHSPAFAAPSQPETLKVLVVEDNLTNQKVIVCQLQSLGYAVEVASDGQTALDVLAVTAYPIILMDCRLPKVDGYMTTRLIRQQEQHRGATNPAIIIALTANDDSQAQQEAMAAGMNDFLTKPLRRETLAVTLEHWNQILCKQQSVDPLSHQVEALDDIDSQMLTRELWQLHFDWVRLRELSDHNREFEQELLQIYLDDTQDQLQHLEQAIDRQNLQHIERIAHHMKGASASIGAKQIETIARTVEQQAKQQQLELIRGLMPQLKQGFSQIQMLIEAQTKPV
jgi:CheY-like chemotaxis protein